MGGNTERDYHKNDSPTIIIKFIKTMKDMLIQILHSKALFFLNGIVSSPMRKWLRASGNSLKSNPL